MKNLIIIISGFFILLALTYIFKSENIQYKYDEVNIELDKISTQKDSLFELADEVLDDVIHEKEINDSIFSELDNQVRNKEITIEQQVYQLKLLLKESKNANKFAQEQKDIAQQMEEMSVIQKMESDKSRMILEEKYEVLLKENKDLLKELEKYKKMVSKDIKKFDNVMLVDTLVNDGIIELEDDGVKKKKKKKKN